ncbi:MAG TPA: AAA family ATPase, partial [Ktedonobacteraceae bacterium]|nr:AAA family ATPase [Ktedonobacteraceae bacterium]
PFDGGSFEPLNVLLIDCENSRKQVRRAFKVLRTIAGKSYQHQRLMIARRPGGIDLPTPDDRAWLELLLMKHKPNVVLIGPLYKMYSQDDKDQPAKKLAWIMDDMRERHQFALIIEAHSPYANNGQARVIRPYGPSLWSRWPEFGINLAPNGKLDHWRGPRDEDRYWPVSLTRDGKWLWNVTPRKELLWNDIVELTQDEGKLSIRQLAEKLKVSKSQVERCLNEHKESWEMM